MSTQDPHQRCASQSTGAFDQARRYLVSVARLDLPTEPDEVHLSVMTWNDRMSGWLTESALCGRSTTQGALANDVRATCRKCWAYESHYRSILDAEVAALDALAGEPEGLELLEDGAWHTVWLEGDWRQVTRKMTAPQREYAADRVAAYSRHLDSCGPWCVRLEPQGLRWWLDIECAPGQAVEPHG